MKLMYYYKLFVRYRIFLDRSKKKNLFEQHMRRTFFKPFFGSLRNHDMATYSCIPKQLTNINNINNICRGGWYMKSYLFKQKVKKEN